MAIEGLNLGVIGLRRHNEGSAPRERNMYGDYLSMRFDFKSAYVRQMSKVGSTQATSYRSEVVKMYGDYGE